MSTPSRFETDRLIVDEWHAHSPSDEDLAESVVAILTPAVTRSLPAGWQGGYSMDRAAKWITERDQESTNLLIRHRSSGKPAGLMIVFRTDDPSNGSPVRIGYMLAESAWGQGIGTELLNGFIGWSRTAGVASIVGGVERENIASQRVMEKTGFVVQPGDASDGELSYRLDL